MSRNPGFDKGIERLKLNICNPDIMTGFSEAANNDPTYDGLSHVEQTGYAVAQSMHETYVAKDSDYASNGKPMGNLRISEEVGIEPWRACLLRMMDKMSRIKSFRNKGTYAVADEKITDTLIDMANYALLAQVLFSEEIDDDTMVENFDAVSVFAVRCKLMYDLAPLFPGTDEWSGKAFDDLDNDFESLKTFARDE